MDPVTTNVVDMVVPDVGATLSVPLMVIAVSIMISYVLLTKNKLKPEVKEPKLKLKRT